MGVLAAVLYGIHIYLIFISKKNESFSHFSQTVFFGGSIPPLGTKKIKFKMKILNLYAGLGGNRKLWGDDYYITAVENDPATAEFYKSQFPNDQVIVADAHDFLLKNFKDYDFIWASPPCPTHSRLNHMRTRPADYPDMRLYQEIIFLKKWFSGMYVVENVIPYYQPLIPAKMIDRHLFWANFEIDYFSPKTKALISSNRSGEAAYLSEIFGFNVSETKIRDKRKALRNCVHPETDRHILQCAINNRNF